MKCLMIFVYVFAYILTCKISYIKSSENAAAYGHAIDAVNRVVNLIHQRFEYHNKNRYQFFLSASNMPSYAWDILKYKFAMKIIQQQQSKNATFLMIFGGSSVTAGHDNYFNESYPTVVERRLQPIFDKLNIKLIVHNIAMGANNCRPYDFCYQAMGGLPGVDIDWIGWEQSYNCGRSNDIYELMARIASSYKAVLYFAASGGFIPDGCKASTDSLPYINEYWTPEIANIKDKYVLNSSIVTDYRTLLDRWYEDGNPVERFINPLRGKYQGTGHHGFSVWGHTRSLCVNDLKNNSIGCSPLDVLGPCLYENGSHWMTIETAKFSKDDGHVSSHHPPAGMHLLRGETLAYMYAHIIMDAIYMVENDLKKHTQIELLERYQSELSKLQSPAPSAEECKTQCHCRNECETLPVCYTNYEPHFNTDFTLDSLLVGNYTGWEYVRKAGSQNVANKKYGYLDYRPCYEVLSSVQNAEIHLKVHVPSSAPFIYVCGYNVKESLKHALFYLDLNTEGSNSSYVPSSRRVVLKERKYNNDECTKLLNVPVGNHVLTVATNPESKQHNQLLSLSHIITFS